MKQALIVGISLLLILLVSGCATYQPVNLDFCNNDTVIPGPTHEKCVWDMSGQTFEIGTDSKTGQQDLYTAYGQSLTADQYEKDAIRMSPWAFAAFRANILGWCHDHSCPYTALKSTFKQLEESLNLDRSIVPEWTDEMLGKKHEP